MDDTPVSSPGCEYQFGIFPSGKGCFASYTKCANGVPSQVIIISQVLYCAKYLKTAWDVMFWTFCNQVYCQLGLAYDHRIHTCNWPDLLMEYAGEILSDSKAIKLSFKQWQFFVDRKCGCSRKVFWVPSLLKLPLFQAVTLVLLWETLGENSNS